VISDFRLEMKKKTSAGKRAGIFTTKSRTVSLPNGHGEHEARGLEHVEREDEEGMLDKARDSRSAN